MKTRKRSKVRDKEERKGEKYERRKRAMGIKRGRV
jgi:hypothetical protein